MGVILLPKFVVEIQVQRGLMLASKHSLCLATCHSSVTWIRRTEVSRPVVLYRYSGRCLNIQETLTKRINKDLLLQIRISFYPSSLSLFSCDQCRISFTTHKIPLLDYGRCTNSPLVHVLHVIRNLTSAGTDKYGGDRSTPLYTHPCLQHLVLARSRGGSQNPSGWDFEDVKFREDPILDTWWFVPWSNTEHCGSDEEPLYTGKLDKLFCSDANPIREEYRGSGIVVDEIEGRVVGCYKVRADTEDGDDVKEEIAEVKHEQWLGEQGKAYVEGLPKRKSKKKIRRMGMFPPDPKEELSLSDKTSDGKPLDLPNEIRKLNGLLLDPRPVRIALHPNDREVFRIHGGRAGVAFKDYGARYKHMEYKIRCAMKDTFDKKQDLPVYRLKHIKAGKKAGRPEVEFTEDENVKQIKVEVEDDDCHEGGVGQTVYSACNREEDEDREEAD
ncbi:hypothetical protein PMIN07_008825 [Paraphaeosphaeria minitans]